MIELGTYSLTLSQTLTSLTDSHSGFWLWKVDFVKSLKSYSRTSQRLDFTEFTNCYWCKRPKSQNVKKMAAFFSHLNQIFANFNHLKIITTAESTHILLCYVQNILSKLIWGEISPNHQKLTSTCRVGDESIGAKHVNSEISLVWHKFQWVKPIWPHKVAIPSFPPTLIWARNVNPVTCSHHNIQNMST